MENFLENFASGRSLHLVLETFVPYNLLWIAVPFNFLQLVIPSWVYTLNRLYEQETRRGRRRISRISRRASGQVIVVVVCCNLSSSRWPRARSLRRPWRRAKAKLEVLRDMQRGLQIFFLWATVIVPYRSTPSSSGSNTPAKRRTNK